MITRFLLAFWHWLTDDDVSPPPANAPTPTTAAQAAPIEAATMSIVSNLPSLLAKLRAVAALTPLLTTLVQTVEAALPAGTPGADKLKAVQDALASVYAKEQIAEASFAEIWPMLAGVATTLVATFHSTGTFVSASPKPAAN